MHRPRGPAGRSVDSPGVVVVDDHDGRDPVLRQGLELHAGVAHAGVAGDAEHRRPAVGLLGTDAVHHRGSGADRVTDIRSDGAVLVGAVQDLAGPVGAKPAPGVAGDAVAARDHGRLLLRQVAGVQEVREFLGDHGGMDRVRRGAVLESEFVPLRVLLLERVAGGRQFGSPGWPRRRRQRLRESLQAAAGTGDEPQIDRQVAADVRRVRVDPDHLGVRVERDLTDVRHGVLADEDDEVCREQGIRSGAHRQRMAVREVAAHRPGLDDRDVRPLRHRAQDIPGPVVEHAGRGDDDRPFGLPDHLDDLLGVRPGRVWKGLGAVGALVVVVEQVVRRFEPGPRDLAGEVEVDRSWHAGAQVPEGVGGVLVDPVRGDQPLAVLLQPHGGRLLVAALDAAFRVVAPDRHVARQHEQRRTGGVGGADVHDHVREPRPLGARAGGGLAGDPDEAVGGSAHAALGAAAVGGDALRGDRVDHLVVAGGAEERLEALVGAGPGEDLGAVHRKLGRVRGFVTGAGNLFRNADRPLLAVGGGSPGLLREQGGGAHSGGAGSARGDEAAAGDAGICPGGGRVRGVLRRRGPTGRAFRFVHGRFSGSAAARYSSGPRLRR